MPRTRPCAQKEWLEFIALLIYIERDCYRYDSFIQTVDRLNIEEHGLWPSQLDT